MARASLFTVFVLAMWASAAAAAQTPATGSATGSKATLEQGTRDFERNAALGAALNKRAGTPAEMRELQTLAERGLKAARESASNNPDSAEASYLLGSWLIYGYRVVRTRQVTVSATSGATSEVAERVVQGMHEDCQEGLDALQRAATLDPKRGQYAVDYGAALLDCGQEREATGFLKTAWADNHNLTAPERMRVGLLLSDISERQGDLAGAREWVYSALGALPENAVVVQYLQSLDAELPKVEAEAAAEAEARAAEAAAAAEAGGGAAQGEESAPASTSSRKMPGPTAQADPGTVRRCPFELAVGSGIVLAAGTAERSIFIPRVDYGANTVTEIVAGRWSITGQGRVPLRLQVRAPAARTPGDQSVLLWQTNVAERSTSPASEAAVFGGYVWQDQPFEVYLDGALVGSFKNTAEYTAARGK
jgi:hypothetical protein